MDGRGIPLSIVVSGANVHDVKLLDPTLKQKIIRCPSGQTQNLCADAGHKGSNARQIAQDQSYIPHIKQRREEAQLKKRKPKWKARRWVVERTHSWINRFRKLLVSFEKTAASHSALLSLACSMICWRQTISIYG